MSPTKTLKVRVALLCVLVGTVLALVAVVTDHWAVLSPHVEHHNTTCEAAHFGLWRICTKRIFVGDKERSCGPITLPGGNVPAPPGPVGGRGSPDRIRAAPAAPGQGAVGQPSAWAGAAGRPRWGSAEAEAGCGVQALVSSYSRAGVQGWSGAGVWMGGQTSAQERERGSTDSAWTAPHPQTQPSGGRAASGGVHSRLKWGHTPKGLPGPGQKENAGLLLVIIRSLKAAAGNPVSVPPGCRP